MFLQYIEISHFRNLKSAIFSMPRNGLAIISGPNGSGKTTLLESIYALTYGKSFRTSDSPQLIQHGQDSFALFATLLPNDANNLQALTVGVQRDRNRGVIAQCLGEPEKFSEIARMLPIRIISPTEAYVLINGGPEQRRKFLDWGVFHVKHSYWGLLKKLSRIIKQKSAALKMRCSDEELEQWNQILCEVSYALDNMRQEYINQLKQIFAEYQALLPAIQDISLEYFPGWARGNDDLPTQLSTVLKQERQQGHCLIGPHRAEILLNTPFGTSKDQLSRGRQKMLAIALYLAQGKLLYQEKGQHPLYLIDDFSSELDLDGQQLLVDALDPKDKQIIITTLEAGQIVLDKICMKTDAIKRYTILDGNLVSC